MVVLHPALRAIPGNQLSCSAIGTPPIHTAVVRNFTVLVNTTKTAKIKLYEEGKTKPLCMIEKHFKASDTFNGPQY